MTKHLMSLALFAAVFMAGYSLAAYFDDRWS